MCILRHVYTQRSGRRDADQYRYRRRVVVSSHGCGWLVDQTSHSGRGLAAAGSRAQAGQGARGTQGTWLGRRSGRNAPGPPATPVMILVDSSVWIAHLRGHRTPATAKLEAAASREPLLIGDLILLEVLQGARDESHAAQIERGLRRYALVPLLDADLAP